MGVFDFFKTKAETPLKVECVNLETTVKTITPQIAPGDMEQFLLLPFSFAGCKFIGKSDEPQTAYVDLDQKNQVAAWDEIEKINLFIEQSRNYSALIPKNIRIPNEEIVYSQYNESYGYSRLICSPYTLKGNKSKYPLKFIFMTKSKEATYIQKRNKVTVIPADSTNGEIVYAQDGQPAKAKVNFWRDGVGFFYEFKTIGRTFLINRIKSTAKRDITDMPVVIYEENLN